MLEIGIAVVADSGAIAGEARVQSLGLLPLVGHAVVVSVGRGFSLGERGPLRPSVAADIAGMIDDAC